MVGDGRVGGARVVLLGGTHVSLHKQSKPCSVCASHMAAFWKTPHPRLPQQHDWVAGGIVGGRVVGGGGGKLPPHPHEQTPVLKKTQPRNSQAPRLSMMHVVDGGRVGGRVGGGVAGRPPPPPPRPQNSHSGSLPRRGETAQMSP